MRTILIGEIIIFLILLFSFTILADRLPPESEPYCAPVNNWDGIWKTDSFTIYIQQKDPIINGSYIPRDFHHYDPGLLKGTVYIESYFSGTSVESGYFLLNLSHNNLSFYGTEIIPPIGPMQEPYIFPIKGIKIDDVSDRKNTWNGTWKTEKRRLILNQTGISLSGIYQSLDPKNNDEYGVLTGKVSNDMKSVNLNWTMKRNFFLTIDPYGKFFDSSYHLNPNDYMNPDQWKGVNLNNSAFFNKWKAIKMSPDPVGISFCQ